MRSRLNADALVGWDKNIQLVLCCILCHSKIEGKTSSGEACVIYVFSHKDKINQAETILVLLSDVIL